MIIDVIMPKMGESITEGTILEWKKEVGDNILKDETLLEISTDKVDSEVPSPSKGNIIEILYDINTTIEVGKVIARIATDGEKVIESKEIIQEVIEHNSENIIKNNTFDQNKDIIIPRINNKDVSIRFLSPLVKSIVKKEGISESELEKINGSGRNNRINKKDILAFLETRSSIKEVPIPHIPEELSPSVNLEDRIEKMDRVRLKIAHHMVESVKTSPHVYSTSETDMTNIVNLKDKYKEKYQSKYGVKLTYNPFILNACIKAIQEFPLLNARIDNENIIHQQNINLGIAVALPNGNLIVPNIKSAEERNFLGLTRKSIDLALRARDNKLDPDDIFGSTFTVTNPGMFGSLFGMGIINQPNVAILSIGSIKKRPVVKETKYGDVIVIRSMMYLTLGYDHRLIDGVYGTKFLGRVCNILENFDEKEIK